MPQRGPFQPTDRAAWRAQVNAQLGVGSFDELLVTGTVDGLRIQPLYDQGHFEHRGDPSGAPGVPPFLRGSEARLRGPGWDIRQVHAHPDPQEVGPAVAADLEGGASSVLLRLASTGTRGIRVGTVDDLGRCLEGLNLGEVPLGIDAGAEGPAALATLISLARVRGVPTERLKGHLHMDPLGSLARTGRLLSSLEETWDQVADAVAWCETHAPGLRPLMVDTAPYHGAGAGAAQDLAFAVSTGVEVLRSLERRGLEPEQISRGLAFSVSLGCDFLLSIARIRALRWLWSRVGEASGFTADMDLHVGPSERILTQRDPWVNILRGTAVGLAGAIGGADHIHVAPFDQALGLPEDLGRRVARNTQTMLMHEAHLGWVSDPAGGSWALETLTRELGSRAWEIAGEIEELGGMTAALQSGAIGTWIDEQATERARRVAERTSPITGVSSFPLLTEEKLVRSAGTPVDQIPGARAGAPNPAPGGGALTEALIETVRDQDLPTAVATLRGEEQATAPDLPLRRLAAPYESLRDRSDDWRTANGQRPRVFLANLGSLAAHTARASFVRNLLAAGGIEAVGDHGFQDTDGMGEAFVGSGARVAFICGDIRDYERLAVDSARVLRAAGAEGLWLAGDPGPLEDALRGAGLEHHVAQGCDALEVLNQLWREVSG